MFWYCKFGWALDVLHFIYSSTYGSYGVRTPFVYELLITGSALVLGGAFIVEILRRACPKLKQISKTDLCVICRESFKPEVRVTVLSCTHLYHFWCISLWFQTKYNCPLCRKPPEREDVYKIE